MRLFLSVLLSALALVALPSCSTKKLAQVKVPSLKLPEVKDGDILTFKLSDLTRFGQPRIVKVSKADLERLDLTTEQVAALDNRQKAQLARHIANEVAGPIDFDPPSLPDAGLVFDGSLLPPKDGASAGAGSTALLNVPGPVPGSAGGREVNPWENFSIE